MTDNNFTDNEPVHSIDCCCPQCEKEKMPTVGVSNFARSRHKPKTGYTYFTGTENELIEEILENWSLRQPGFGRDNCDKVVVVPVSPKRFCGTIVKIDQTLDVESKVVQRQPQEDPYIETIAVRSAGFAITPEPCTFAKVVLYSAEALLENNGERSGEDDWEVVCILAGTNENEPMTPLTLARNFLEKAGGTKCEYTAQQFAESIYYWSQHCKAKI